MGNTEESLVVMDLGSLLDRLPVAGFEERAYVWLMREFWAAEFKKLPRSKRQLLSIRFTPSGQLCVNYNGSSVRKDRLVLLCHVDREGVTADLSAVDRLPNAEPSPAPAPVRRLTNIAGTKDYIQPFTNQPVCISIGSSEIRATICAFIEHEGGYAITPLNGHDAGWLFEEDLAGVRVAITPTPAPDRFDPDSPEGQTLFAEKSKQLTASALDNAVGVIAGTHAMRTLVSSRQATNMSIVYTIGEESGFLGTLALACEPPPGFWAGERLHAIIVDTSSRLLSHTMHLGAWRNAIEANTVFSRQHFSRINQAAAAVRLCDRAACFSHSLSRLLLQAALSAAASYQPKSPVQCGLFVGGFCEGAVISLSDWMRDWSGTDSGAPWASCGAIAIPLGNYRGIEKEDAVSDNKKNEAGDDNNQGTQAHTDTANTKNSTDNEVSNDLVKPEYIQLSAVVHATQLLVSAASLMPGYSLVGDGRQFAIEVPDLSKVDEFDLSLASQDVIDARLKKWKDRYNLAWEPGNRLATMKAWSQTSGAAILREINAG